MTILYILLAVALVALIVLVVLFFLKKKKAKAAAAQAGETAWRPAAMRSRCWCTQPSARLSAAKLEQGAKIANLPVYLLMGDPAAPRPAS